MASSEQQQELYSSINQPINQSINQSIRLQGDPQNSSVVAVAYAPAVSVMSTLVSTGIVMVGASSRSDSSCIIVDNIGTTL
jgi:hypothetical protein